MSPIRIVILMCCAEVLSMTAFGTFSALIPTLLPEWHITNTQAGLISGVLFGGYMATVPILTSLTDRIDARRVYLLACVLAALGALGFTFGANGVMSALAFQALIGAGLAGTYMPGLKLLSDLIPEGLPRSRSVAFYTATFGLGSAMSLVIVGLAEPTLGWRAVFLISAFGPLAAAALVWLTLPAPPPAAHVETPPRLLDFRPVFRNRAAVGYILGYAAHCYELFGARSWIVAFLTFCATLQPIDHPLPWHPAWLIAVISPIVIPSSLIGNEIATRRGRRNVILTIMGASALVGCVIGFLAPLPWYAAMVGYAIYIMLIMSDSSALTNGVIAEASAHLRGTTMAIYSFLGFGAALISPLVFGAVLDAAGGNTRVLAWGLAFASLGVGGLGSIAVLVSRFRSRRAARAVAG
ncbi:MAG: nitrate/nitrite transporter [Sulfurifustis sp.]